MAFYDECIVAAASIEGCDALDTESMHHGLIVEDIVKKSRYTEEQMAFALEQAALGTPVAEACRKMGISDATFYNWR
ncbi:transposase [Mycetohabitans endofungorum]|uniref:Transposase n=1 Tax=Mycetohabitans endofungorum TaxID=417203 RepID=A0A2P5KB36_9BURK|nr:transposase [Mycetohabitans endofungorum]